MKTAYVKTFGCQMNAHDSEKITAMLISMGYEIKDDINADLIILNTCCVRENPEDKLFGNLGYLKNQKKLRPGLKIVLCGCMMQQPHVIQKLIKSYSFVDVVFGTFNIHKLPELLKRNETTRSQIIDIWDSRDEDVEVYAKRVVNFKANVNIIYGCNNFCTYCVVPFVRGREKSRPSSEIVNEVRKLVNDDGVLEIILLGQNVNSYGNDLEQKTNFAELIHELNEIEKLKRIRFMTSHPKDLSDELIEALRSCDKLCKHLHLPLQSGSDRILKLMNRKYTREQYLKLVDKTRSLVPNVSITTDLIIGFPSETDDDINDTIDVIKHAEFNNAFTFMYSKRNGTLAADMPEQIPQDIAKKRFDYLLSELNDIILMQSRKCLGKTVTVLVESKTENEKLSGRTDNNYIVHFEGDVSLIGKLVDVEITECKTFYLCGKIKSKGDIKT